MVNARNKKNEHLAQLVEHWFEWKANQMDVGSNPTVMEWIWIWIIWILFIK